MIHTSIILSLILNSVVSLAKDEKDDKPTNYRWETQKCSIALGSVTAAELMTKFKEYIETKNDIPETPKEILAGLATFLGIENQKTLSQLFGAGKLFKDVNDLVDQAIVKYPTTFENVIDHRIFTQKKSDQMMAAIRNAGNIILVKLAENQDIKDFEATLAMAKDLNAPIIVKPAFKEVGNIPKKFSWLFKTPNVYVLTEDIQYTKNVHFIDPGYEDKRQNPIDKKLMELYPPTDKVIVFHPRVRLVTRPSGTYDTHPSYFVTTGSISEPAYHGEFDVSMSTDFKAQLEAEKNRSVIIYSRLYKNDIVSSASGGAYGSAPRRARWVESRYGNPAGFFDLGNLYTNEGKIKLKVIPGIIPGDLHLGITDPATLKAFSDLLKNLGILKKNPNYGKFNEYEYIQGDVQLGAIVIEDLVNGDPNSRYVLENLISKTVSDANGHLDLENHFQLAAAWLKQHLTMLPNTRIIIPEDNHGYEWLMKILQKGELMKSKGRDVPMVLKLMYDAITEGANPYKRIFEYYGVDMDRVLFLSAKTTYRLGIDITKPNPFSLIQGADISQHGQNGTNGMPGISISQMLISYGANATGHRHMSGEYGQSVSVGTLTPRKLDFHRGPSTSNASVGLLYSEDAIQLLHLERDSFVPNGETQSPDDFFSPGLPRIVERRLPPEGGKTTDQYRRNPPGRRTRQSKK